MWKETDYYRTICLEKNLMRVVGRSLGQEQGVSAISEVVELLC